MEITIFTTCSPASLKQQALFQPFPAAEPIKLSRSSPPLSPELKVDQSLSHDGVCLTVESVTEHTYQVTAIAETLSKTILSDGDPEAGSIWKDVFHLTGVWTDIWFRVMSIARQNVYFVRIWKEAGFFVSNSLIPSGISS